MAYKYFLAIYYADSSITKSHQRFYRNRFEKIYRKTQAIVKSKKNTNPRVRVLVHKSITSWKCKRCVDMIQEIFLEDKF